MTEISAERKPEIVRRYNELKQQGMSDDEVVAAVCAEYNVNADLLRTLVSAAEGEDSADDTPSGAA